VVKNPKQCLFHHVLITIQLNFKNSEIIFLKVTPPVGFKPAIPEVWGYGTPVQWDVQKKPAENAFKDKKIKQPMV